MNLSLAKVDLLIFSKNMYLQINLSPIHNQYPTVNYKSFSTKAYN